jgi:exonuclease VII large subunit
MIELIGDVYKVSRELQQGLGREPDAEEIGKAMGTTAEKVRQILRAAKQPISLETPVGEDEGNTISDFIADRGARVPSEAADDAMLKIQVESALMELNGRSGQNDFSPERASEYVDYWRNASQQILNDSEATASETVLKSYSHDTAAAANLMAAHQFSAEAEEAYRMSAQLWPQNPAAVGGLTDLLAQTGREKEARQMLDNFARDYPERLKDLERVLASSSITWTAPTTKP